MATFALAAVPFRWADPEAWPWAIWVWIAFMLVGFAKPLWRWFRRQRARDWPRVQGQIDSVNVTKSNSWLPSTSLRGERLLYMAKLKYSYAFEGNHYSDTHRREFESEQEASEYIRDLPGKPVFVSCNPENPAKSVLSRDAVADLLNARLPAPEGGSEARESELPGWVRFLLWPFLVLSAVGLVLSLWIHLGALAGRKGPSDDWLLTLTLGIFLVFPPALIGNIPGKDHRKTQYSRAPWWMRYMVYGLLGYLLLSWAVLRSQMPSGSFSEDPPVVVWREISCLWMLFYAMALTSLYGAFAPSEDQAV